MRKHERVWCLRDTGNGFYANRVYRTRNEARIALRGVGGRPWTVECTVLVPPADYDEMTKGEVACP